MTSLNRQSLITAVLMILVLSFSSAADAACSGSRSKSKGGSTSRNRNHSTTPKKRKIAKTNKASNAAKQVAVKVESKSSAMPVSHRRAESNKVVAESEAIETTIAPETTEISEARTVKYLVIQESKPGAGLDLNDTTNPATNRGEFSDTESAEASADMWRDVMPGWEVEVVAIN